MKLPKAQYVYTRFLFLLLLFQAGKSTKGKSTKGLPQVFEGTHNTTLIGVGVTSWQAGKSCTDLANQFLTRGVAFNDPNYLAADPRACRTMLGLDTPASPSSSVPGKPLAPAAAKRAIECSVRTAFKSKRHHSLHPCIERAAAPAIKALNTQLQEKYRPLLLYGAFLAHSLYFYEERMLSVIAAEEEEESQDMAPLPVPLLASSKLGPLMAATGEEWRLDILKLPTLDVMGKLWPRPGSMLPQAIMSQVVTPELDLKTPTPEQDLEKDLVGQGIEANNAESSGAKRKRRRRGKPSGDGEQWLGNGFVACT